MTDLIPIFKLLHNKKSIILTGAGISCNAGIPDFRSSSGLYVKAINNSKLKGKEVFDISILQTGRENIGVFAKFMNDLYLDIQQAHPTKTHRFIDELIMKEGKNTGCVRCYTQNIDDLEFSKEKVVQLHGNITRLKCTSCGLAKSWDSDIHKALSQGHLPPCTLCLETQELRILNGKRSSSYQVGAMKPDIILYGEFNHQHAEDTLNFIKQDMKTNPDILLIMGTSLKVHGVKNLVKEFAKKIHTKKMGRVVLVNNEKLKGWEGIIDDQLEMDCDSFVNCYNNWRESLANKSSTAATAASSKGKSTKHQQVRLPTPPSTPSKKRVRDLLSTTPSSTPRKRASAPATAYSSSSSPSKLPWTPSSTPSSGYKRIRTDESMLLGCSPVKKAKIIEVNPTLGPKGSHYKRRIFGQLEAQA